VASGSREIAFAGRPLEVRTAELRGGNGQRLVTWQWYWINGRLTSSDYVGKAYTALARLLGQGDDSAVVVLFAPKEEAGGGESTLQAFVQSAGGAIETTLRNADEKKAGAQ
jgi:EpsI family protein